MVWIKRNLIFVISAAIGVVLMAGAGYFLWSSINDTATSKDDLAGAVTELQNLQNKAPYPSKENVATAKEQQQQVKELLSQVKSSFVALPTMPKTDERGFKSLVDKSIAQLQDAATNAGVGLPAQFAFSFSAITTKLNFPAQNIEPWAAQLQEIQQICGVLFASKVNYLESIRRVPVAAEEPSGPEFLAAAPLVTPLYTSTPYEITFKAFSGELASLLNGFQHATTCFVVENIDVQPLAPGGTETAVPVSVTPGRGLAGQPVGLGRGTPVTILSEKPLRITLVVNVIKLKTT